MFELWAEGEAVSISGGPSTPAGCSPAGHTHAARSPDRLTFAVNLLWDSNEVRAARAKNLQLRTDADMPVWPSGKALGWEAEGPWFDPLRFSFLFSSKIVVYGHYLVTLPTQVMKH